MKENNCWILMKKLNKKCQFSSCYIFSDSFQVLFGLTDKHAWLLIFSWHLQLHVFHYLIFNMCSRYSAPFWSLPRRHVNDNFEFFFLWQNFGPTWTHSMLSRKELCKQDKFINSEVTPIYSDKPNQIHVLFLLQTSGI